MSMLTHELTGKGALTRGDVVLEGAFVDGLLHGYGTHTVQHNGSRVVVYKGQYRSNHRCGYGVLNNLDDGTKYEGWWSINCIKCLND